MRRLRSGAPVVTNGENWGFGELELPQEKVGRAR